MCEDCTPWDYYDEDEVIPTMTGGLDKSAAPLLLDDVFPLVPVDTAERLSDGRTVIRPSDSPCRKHGIRKCPKCGR